MAEREARATDAPAGARAVSASYERHPYPPPVDDLDHYRRRWTDVRRRAISEIAPRAAQRDAAKVLFEGLWWYDQIVFETPLQPGRDPSGVTHS